MVPIDAGIRSLDYVVFAKDQPEYLPLPARVADDGTVVTCWQLSWRERWLALWTGKFFLTVLTFRRPLQPIRVSIERPEEYDA